MALAKLTPDDVGAPALAKINAAIQAVDDVAAEASRELIAVNKDLGNRIQGVSDQANGRVDSTNSDVSALEARVDDLAARDVASFVSVLLALRQAGRPGALPAAFTAAAIGDLTALPPLGSDGVVTGAFGQAYRLAGAGLIAPRLPVLVDVDSINVLTFRYWRLTDVLDPNNNAVDLGIQWLDATGADKGKTLLRRDVDLQVQSGPRAVTFRVPSLPRDRVAITPPTGAVAWRPYLKTYGADGATAVERLSVTDVTFAGTYAPDVTALSARMGTIEGQLAAGLPLATPILPSFVVADLPTPGNRGRKAFASDGRAPNAAGALEAANAGTGVEVTDNGTAWVITGTNQQVQA